MMLTRETPKTFFLNSGSASQSIGVTTGGYRNIRELLHHACPGLMASARKVIEASEFTYCNNARKESFLWQHTVYVASMAMTLSYKEGIDPLLPVLISLFHDSGKFDKGKFHAGSTPEEEKGAAIAMELMAAAGFSQQTCWQVRNSLLALHNDTVKGDINTGIVNDADFLVKFGHMGFANFFEKSVLRGMVVRSSILKTLSKELTYAASLATHMQTRSGKAMARKKAAVSISLFRNYLEELRIAGIADYEIRKTRVSWCEDIRIFLVLPRVCEHCFGRLTASFGREKGIKRERLAVHVDCPVCKENNRYGFSFCLPRPESHRPVTGGSDFETGFCPQLQRG